MHFVSWCCFYMETVLLIWCYWSQHSWPLLNNKQLLVVFVSLCCSLLVSADCQFGNCRSYSLNINIFVKTEDWFKFMPCLKIWLVVRGQRVEASCRTCDLTIPRVSVLIKSHLDTWTGGCVEVNYWRWSLRCFSLFPFIELQQMIQQTTSKSPEASSETGLFRGCRPVFILLLKSRHLLISFTTRWRKEQPAGAESLLFCVPRPNEQDVQLWPGHQLKPKI